MSSTSITRRSFISSVSTGAAAAAIMPQAAVGLSAAQPSPSWNTGFAYDDGMLEHTHSTEVSERLVVINQAMAATGLDALVTPVAFLDNPYPHIEAVHTTSHIEQVSAIPRTGEAARLAVAGLLGAVKAVHNGTVRNAFCAIRPPGHHAHNVGGEEGFCFYGNVAIAARYAQSLGYARVLIVDWDYHHGNGTQDVFYADGSVFFVSTHNWYDYPGTGSPGLTGEGDGAGYNLNIHLECGATDSQFLSAFDMQIIPLADDFKPDFVLISAGFDSRRHDLLGCFEITDNGFAEATRKLMALADTHCDGRIVSALEGGYRVTDEVIGGTHTGTIGDAAAAHVSALLGLAVPVAPPAGTQASRLNDDLTISNGRLRFGSVDPGEIRRVRVLDPAGRLVYEAPLSALRGDAIDLRRAGLAAGRYHVRVDRRHAAPIVRSLYLAPGMD